MFESPTSDSEKFVRAHCLFVCVYGNAGLPSVYCHQSTRNSDIAVSGSGETIDIAWDDVANKTRQRLAYLATVAESISEVDNSSLPNKNFIAAILRDLYEESGRGIRL